MLPGVKGSVALTGKGQQDQSEKEEDPQDGVGESSSSGKGVGSTPLLLNITQKDGQSIESVPTPSPENEAPMVAEKAAG